MNANTSKRGSLLKKLWFIMLFGAVLTFTELNPAAFGNVGVQAAVTKDVYRAKTLKNLEKVYKYYKKAYYSTKEYEKLTAVYNEGVDAVNTAGTKSSIKKVYKKYKKMLREIEPSVLIKYQNALENSLLKTYKNLTSKNRYSDANLVRLAKIKDEALDQIYGKKTKKRSKKVKTEAVAAMKRVEVYTGEPVEALAPVPVDINTANFPDTALRSVISADFDSDGNGILDEDEIILARNLWCNGRGIKSLKGIEYLVELRGLYCMDNEIETMDLSRNKLLTGVWCSGNKFKTLDFTPNPVLEWVYCFDCELTSLNISNNPEMSYLECSTNPLKTLDVTNNPKLEHLICGSCELTELDLKNNPELQHLDAFRNRFKSLDISNNKKLKRLDIWDNPGLGSLDISNCSGLQYYNCANNDVKSLDVSHNPELQKLVCSYNDIKKLDLSNNHKLAILNCEDNKLSKLDLTGNPMLRYLQAAINDITKLNIGNNPYLVKTYNEGKYQQEWFGCSWTIDYGGDDSTGGDSLFYIWVNDGVTFDTKSMGNVYTVPEKYSDLDAGVSEKDLLTREQVVQFLYEMAGSPDINGSKTRFTDVESGTPYEKALLWGEKNAICVGYPYTAADTFGVGKWITRQDLAFMLMRYSETVGYKRAIDFGRSDEYIDYFDIDYDHWEAVCWCATWMIMEGKGELGSEKSEQRFDPYGRVTSAEFKAAIDRLIEVNS